MLEELEKELEVSLVEKGKQRNKEFLKKVVRFTQEARKHYGELIKSVLVFGSAARGKLGEKSDVDVWVILDDTVTKSSEDLEKITMHLYSIAHELKDLHLQQTLLTEFWRMLRVGSPEFTNFLRYGLPIYDSGFIKPVQRLLQEGLLTPSEEAVALKARAAQARLKKLELDLQSMIFDLRYCAVDAAQAAIMHHFKEQPDPKAIPQFLEKFVEQKKLEKAYVQKFEELNALWKKIEHKEVKAEPKHLEYAMQLSKQLVERLGKLVEVEE